MVDMSTCLLKRSMAHPVDRSVLFTGRLRSGSVSGRSRLSRRGAFGVNAAARTRRHSHQTSRLVSDAGAKCGRLSPNYVPPNSFCRFFFCASLLVCCLLFSRYSFLRCSPVGDDDLWYYHMRILFTFSTRPPAPLKVFQGVILIGPSQSLRMPSLVSQGAITSSLPLHHYSYFLSSFLSSFLPSSIPLFLPSSLPSFLPSYLPLFLSSFLQNF